MESTICEKCNKEVLPGSWPFCPHEHVDHATGVITDEIPGGVEIKHGLCNPDGSPRKYYSKTEIKKEADRRGLVSHVQHVPASRGSDKSPWTKRWF